jgi:broad specificity phosphatase PhoE
MKKISVFILVFFICQNLIGFRHSAPGDQDGITAFFLVRHAEKVRDGSADPPLTASGAARAEELAYMLKHIDLNAIYSTPYRRTKQTVMPTAREKGLDVKLYKPGDKGFLAMVLHEYPGGNVLIVGHSNTIPGMANELRGAFAFSDLDDSTYDNMFIACVPAEGKPVILRMRFGAHTPKKE